MPDFIDQLSAALCAELKDEPLQDRRISDLPAVTAESGTVLFDNGSVVAVAGVEHTVGNYYATTAVRGWSHRDDPGLRGEIGPMGPPGQDADMSRVAALERELAAHERQITAIRQLLLNEQVIAELTRPENAERVVEAFNAFSRSEVRQGETNREIREHLTDAMREDLRAEMHEWDARVIGDIRDALPVRLAPHQTLLNQQTLADLQRWGIDELDEETTNQLREAIGIPRQPVQPEAVHVGPPTG
jgi:hypothetical protein